MGGKRKKVIYLTDDEESHDEDDVLLAAVDMPNLRSFETSLPPSPTNDFPTATPYGRKYTEELSSLQTPTDDFFTATQFGRRYAEQVRNSITPPPSPEDQTLTQQLPQQPQPERSLAVAPLDPAAEEHLLRLPYIKPVNMVPGVYPVRRIRYVDTQFGRRLAVSTTNFKYTLPKHFMATYSHINVMHFDDRGITLEFTRRDEGRFGTVHCSLMGLPPPTPQSSNTPGTTIRQRPSTSHQISDNKPSTSSSTKSLRLSGPMGECRVCYERPVDCIFLPCGHGGCCSICVVKFGICPFCRKAVAEVKKLYFI